MPTKPRDETRQPPEGVFESAYQIWLAGLAALIRTQEEGSKLFETLVKEGEAIEAGSRKTADEAAAQATDTWQRLEQLFQDRLSRSLHRLGVPTRDDVLALSRRIEELQEKLKALNAAKHSGKADPGGTIR